MEDIRLIRVYNVFTGLMGFTGLWYRGCRVYGLYGMCRVWGIRVWRTCFSPHSVGSPYVARRITRSSAFGPIQEQAVARRIPFFSTKPKIWKWTGGCHFEKYLTLSHTMRRRGVKRRLL